MNDQIKDLALDINSASKLPLELCSALATDLVEKGSRKKEWISVDERLPDDNGTYLVVGKSGTVHTSHFYKDRVMYGKTYGWHFSNRYVRYWMPLPEPPMKGDKADA